MDEVWLATNQGDRLHCVEELIEIQPGVWRGKAVCRKRHQWEFREGKYMGKCRTCLMMLASREREKKRIERSESLRAAYGSGKWI